MPRDCHPHLGLVCVTHSDECRYRTLTRKRLLSLSADRQEEVLKDLYLANLERLRNALAFCHRQAIRLYRVTSNLFPFSDEPLGEGILRSMGPDLAMIGPMAQKLGIRMLIHPDQFVVLSSDSPQVVETSIRILDRHALAFDLFGLPRSAWSAMILHGGKSNRAEQLVGVIERLAPAIRSRLVLENDEYAYSAAEILSVCQRAGVPMVFDCHHHIIKEKLETYDHPSIGEMIRAARKTWAEPSWQIVHLSNGRESFADPRHSDFIGSFPEAFLRTPWIEVEAKAKEQAIARLRREYPQLA